MKVQKKKGASKRPLCSRENFAWRKTGKLISALAEKRFEKKRELKKAIKHLRIKREGDSLPNPREKKLKLPKEKKTNRGKGGGETKRIKKKGISQVSGD